MKPPRISISALMAAVLLVALDFGLGREVTRLGMPLAELLIIGGFPMANILAVGLAAFALTGRAPGPRRPALAGSLAFGGAAFLSFLACSLLWTRPTHDSIRPIIEASGMKPGLALASFVAVLFLAPQLGVAALGWRLGGRRAGRKAENVGAESGGWSHGPV